MAHCIRLTHRTDLDTARAPGVARVSPSSAPVAPRLGLAVLLLATSLVLHGPSFTARHTEGDEVAYLSLARTMGWDGSGYSTAADPVVSRYPYAIYRAPLFHHPPLFPWLLKLAATLGDPVTYGLVFECIGVAVGMAAMTGGTALLGLDLPAATLGLAALGWCPLIFFSTTRLHTDGLLGVSLLSALVSTIWLLEDRRPLPLAAASIAWAVALNTRFNGLTALPLLPLACIFAAWRHSRRGHGALPPAMLLGVLGTAVCLALAHYARFLVTYGTLLPTRIATADVNIVEWNDFLRRVMQRGPGHTIVDLLALMPLLGLLLIPTTWTTVARGLRDGDWGAFILAATAWMIATNFPFTYQQARFFACITPLAYLGLAWLAAEASGLLRTTVAAAAVLSVPMALATDAVHALVSPTTAKVAPALYLLLPPLKPWLE